MDGGIIFYDGGVVCSGAGELSSPVVVLISARAVGDPIYYNGRTRQMQIHPVSRTRPSHVRQPYYIRARDMSIDRPPASAFLPHVVLFCFRSPIQGHAHSHMRTTRSSSSRWIRVSLAGTTQDPVEACGPIYNSGTTTTSKGFLYFGVRVPWS